MAIFHLHADTIDRAKGGKASMRCSYISRSGKKDLRIWGYGGLPHEQWCIKDGKINPWRFFRNLDLFEVVQTKPRKGETVAVTKAKAAAEADGDLNKKNPSEVVARTIEFALPIELDHDQQLAAVNDFLNRIMTKDGKTMAYAWAIHEGKDNANPHCHIVFSPRQADEFHRPPNLFFSRAKPKHKEQGGATKRSDVGSWSWLKNVRKKWEEVANAALAEAGLSIRISADRIYAQDDPSRPKHKGGWGSRLDMEMDIAAAEVDRLQRELDEELRKELLLECENDIDDSCNSIGPTEQPSDDDNDDGQGGFRMGF